MRDDLDQTNHPEQQTPRGAHRRHQFPGRLHRINLRLNPDEHHDITTAAARAGMTPTGYCAEAALAAARHTTTPGAPIPGLGVTRAELAALQRELFAARTAVIRTGTNLNQAIAALHAVGEPPDWLGHAVARCDRTRDLLDRVAAAIDRRLR